MYIPCFLQVFFPYWEIIKNKKRVKVLKDRSKDLENKRSKKNKKWTPKEKRDKIRHESEQVKIPLLFTFTARIMIMCRFSINVIIHD